MCQTKSVGPIEDVSDRLLSLLEAWRQAGNCNRIQSVGFMRPVPRVTSDRSQLRASLDRLYASFDHPESALDPIQIVRRYPRIADREVVAFVAAGLAFGRVASVMASVEAVCEVLGQTPGAFVRRFEPARDGARLRHLVHRWTRGDDIVSLIWILRHLIDRYGSLEAAFAAGLPSGAVHVGEGLEQWSSAARAVDLQAVY